MIPRLTTPFLPTHPLSLLVCPSAKQLTSHAQGHLCRCGNSSSPSPVPLTLQGCSPGLCSSPLSHSLLLLKCPVPHSPLFFAALRGFWEWPAARPRSTLQSSCGAPTPRYQTALLALNHNPCMGHFPQTLTPTKAGALLQSRFPSL